MGACSTKYLPNTQEPWKWRRKIGDMIDLQSKSHKGKAAEMVDLRDRSHKSREEKLPRCSGPPHEMVIISEPVKKMTLYRRELLYINGGISGSSWNLEKILVIL